MRQIILILLLALAAGCTSQKSAENGAAGNEAATATQAEATTQPTGAATTESGDFAEPTYGNPVEPGSSMYPGGLAKALFAGGCFWCMESPFDKIDGVKATVSGYTGGKEQQPKYKEVARGMTGHTEAVLVIYDPAATTYDQLLDAFWKSHDPTDAQGQFVDRGSQYRPGVYPYDDAQRQAAKASRTKLAESGRFDKPIATEIVDASTFWPAEDYHQDFYKKDPNHYNRYRRGSGRDQFISRVWGD